jgi:aldehyde dehydrogenase (NAD+)
MTYEIPSTLTTRTFPATSDIATEVQNVVARLGIDLGRYGFRDIAPEPITGTHDGTVYVRTPITGESYATVNETSPHERDEALALAVDAFEAFRTLPAPRRGEFVRVLGNYLREYKNELGFLVSVEAGKIVSEGLGEVQEMIDIADLAVGQSRQLFGKTIASERPDHSMRETWHPLGVVGVITAFNFPVAVWAWNACLAFVCGDPVVFKPSDKTTISSIVIHELARRAARETGISENVSQLILGGVEPAVELAKDDRIALLSVTGSVAAGAALAPLVSARFGKTLLELGGNNAMIVAPSADLNLAVRAITFAAAGTAGQRCTSLRRLIVHKDLKTELVDRIQRAYSTLSVGNPLCPDVLVGPLIESKSHDALVNAQSTVGVETLRDFESEYPHAFYHRPTIVEVSRDAELLQHETFAPLLYVTEYEDFEDAIAMNNNVPQGLSSSIFTNDVREAERFLSASGSDCGIANVNIGPSGAEIGGAFGGEKQTGGGRESGSDAWKAYMRRATNTVNYGDTLPLAQGVHFE